MIGDVPVEENDGDTIHLATGLGTAEARRVAHDPQGDSWEITYPWGHGSFNGSRTAVIGQMRENILLNDIPDAV